MLEINTKSDIIIPFERIGDSNWLFKTECILDALADNWNNKMEKPIPSRELEALEARLGTALPANLKLFYTTFGIADIGEELLTLDAITWVKDYWSDNPENAPDFTDEDKRVLPFLVSFSAYLGNGNLFCFHSETNAIYYYDHDGAPYFTKLFDTVDDYFKGCLIFAQVDLPGEDAEQEDVERWVEEIVTEIVGEDVVRKWRY